jgi:carboxylesterase type B
MIMFSSFFVLVFVLLATTVVARAVTNSPLTVDLGYASYTGVRNASTGLTVWKSIRYAQPPVGRLRWQAPQLLSSNSSTNSSTPILADHFGPPCPQSLPQVPGASTLFIPGHEDCLFLNVYAPSSTTDAPWPVLVWIHGGGYGEGDATQDLSGLLSATSHAHPIIAVSIQYRLGAFGFLASAEVQRRGQLNAGLLDQRAALQWV